MTNNQLNRERLEKIKSWRETYGAGSNVMLPAEEAEELARMALAAMDRDKVRNEHAEWSQATFGNVGPVGPLKHLSKEALEAAAEPDDLSEWADMQFLLWDAQRRAGVTDEQITQAMIDKLAVNKQRKWPEPTDGEPRLHIKEQPAPVVLDSYVMVPMRLTAENGAKGALSGEFSETKLVNCPECFGDDECETCDGSGRIEITVPVTWTTIKEIWAKGVEHFAAAPQSPGSEPATVPGKWIPVSEKMPPSRHEVLVGRWWGEKPRWCCKWATYIPGHPDSQSSGWLIPGASWTPTHWMPLPASPQEVKGE
ncbi:DUF550 domain-containing protein [Escherichia coli]|nr:DUF550 domain-containing protein [Escherichia coli]